MSNARFDEPVFVTLPCLDIGTDLIPHAPQVAISAARRDDGEGSGRRRVEVAGASGEHTQPRRGKEIQESSPGEFVWHRERRFR